MRLYFLEMLSNTDIEAFIRMEYGEGNKDSDALITRGLIQPS